MKDKSYMLPVNEKNTRYLSIAGFLIRINFLKSDYENSRRNTIYMIDSVFDGFLVKSATKKIKSNFFIDIKPTATYMFLDKTKNAFIKLYTISDNPNRIISYYSLSIHQFQLILMQVLFWLLVNKGFIVHCSAIKIHDQVILFLGKQGAGKSTAANLLADKYEVLADDSGIIKEEKGKYYFYQGPNIEKNENIKKTDKRYLIKAIFLLKKARVYKVIKIMNKEFTFKKMIDQFLGDLKDSKQKIEFLLKMMNNFNSFYSLFFGKDKIKLKQLIDNEHF